MSANSTCCQYITITWYIQRPHNRKKSGIKSRINGYFPTRDTKINSPGPVKAD
jgi:hypothetical protein